MSAPLAAQHDGRIRALTPRPEAFLRRLAGRPLFACAVASTDTAEIPGISAAGETPEKRRYTAALDAEFLVLGRPVTLPEIPKNPLGPPSPVVITRAALAALDLEALIIDAGIRVAPQTPRLVLGGAPGRCITTGAALEYPPGLWENCRAAGRWLAASAPWLILAESVPGGTTTALSLLEGLGVPARGRVSSSMPGGNHELKDEVVARALAAAGLPAGASALEVAAAVGDPMQPAVAVMALEASLRVPVVLGGGTQMAAVAALALRLLSEGHPGKVENLGLATTRWVADDASADLPGILGDLGGSVAAFAAGLDFGGSAIPNLCRYEEGLVKEGVGAGAAAFAAFLGGWSHADLLGRIEGVVRGL
ncbi:MAG: TIGR00303 family protein [Deltaproteobacteria bacterium]|nr:TIGR00303 family protein [Deltaproteobacteria bacterium]